MNKGLVFKFPSAKYLRAFFLKNFFYVFLFYVQVTGWSLFPLYALPQVLLWLLLLIFLNSGVGGLPNIGTTIFSFVEGIRYCC